MKINRLFVTSYYRVQILLSRNKRCKPCSPTIRRESTFLMFLIIYRFLPLSVMWWRMWLHHVLLYCRLFHIIIILYWFCMVLWWMLFECRSPIISKSVIWIPWRFPITREIEINLNWVLWLGESVKHLFDCYNTCRWNILGRVSPISHKRTLIRISTSEEFWFLFM